MGMLPLKSTVACIEMAEAKDAIRRLGDTIDRVTEDGIVTACERREVQYRKREAIRELDEAMIAAEESDEAAGRFWWTMRAGPDAPLPRHLRDKARGLVTLRATLRMADKPKHSPPAGVTMRLVRKRATPHNAAEKRVRREAIEPRG